MKRQSTEADFEAFQAEVKKWIRLFGFNERGLWFEWTKLSGSQSEYYTDEAARLVIFRFNKGTIMNSISELAKHEVIEGLLLGRLKGMAIDGKFSDGSIEAETHRIVRILENLL